jgi:ribosome maturation factor RimP
MNIYNEQQEENVKITLKRGARGGYAWEIEIKGNDEKDVSTRVTGLNTVYLQLYGKDQEKI